MTWLQRRAAAVVAIASILGLAGASARVGATGVIPAPRRLPGTPVTSASVPATAPATAVASTAAGQVDLTYGYQPTTTMASKSISSTTLVPSSSVSSKKHAEGSSCKHPGARAQSTTGLRVTCVASGSGALWTLDGPPRVVFAAVRKDHACKNDHLGYEGVTADGETLTCTKAIGHSTLAWE